MTGEIKCDVDKDTTVKLKALMGAGYTKLVTGFMTNTQNYIDEIGAALQVQDRGRSVPTAHKMKSSCGQFGLFRLQQLAALIEYAEGLDAQGLIAVHNEMKPAFVRAQDIMKREGLSG